jgi:iduronate 2-sulfatase
LWCKTTNYELDTRVPLIIAAPHLDSNGSQTSAIVELVDLYPTLVELAGLPKPVGLDGQTLVAVMNSGDPQTNDVAYSQFPRPMKRPKVMGYSVRTETHRYTEWRELASGVILARELYDHTKDPGEIRNTADAPESKNHIATLSKMIRQNFSSIK